MAKQTATARLNIRLTPDDYEEIAAFSKESGRDPSAFARRAILILVQIYKAYQQGGEVIIREPGKTERRIIP